MALIQTARSGASVLIRLASEQLMEAAVTVATDVQDLAEEASESLANKAVYWDPTGDRPSREPERRRTCDWRPIHPSLASRFAVSVGRPVATLAGGDRQESTNSR
jgi:hypothetical protein